MVGRSEDWLSKVERGEREIRRLDVIADLAKALRVTVGDLLGQPVLVEDESQRDDDVPAVRDALMQPRRLSRVLFAAQTTRTDSAATATLTEHAWSDFQAGRIGRVISALPSLISTA